MTAEALTINGAHLNQEGNRKIAEIITEVLLNKVVKQMKN